MMNIFPNAMRNRVHREEFSAPERHKRFDAESKTGARCGKSSGWRAGGTGNQPGYL
jgi:hypothetical protein